MHALCAKLLLPRAWQFSAGLIHTRVSYKATRFACTTIPCRPGGCTRFLLGTSIRVYAKSLQASTVHAVLLVCSIPRVWQYPACLVNARIFCKATRSACTPSHDRLLQYTRFYKTPSFRVHANSRQTFPVHAVLQCCCILRVSQILAALLDTRVSC